MSIDTVEKPLKTSAAGQYLGYAIEPVRFCRHLLSVPDGDSVSLEFIDDIAVHSAQGTLALEQCKSSITARGLPDKSNDLWKTFSNWADICSAGFLNPSDVRFVLYLTPGGAGDLVQEMHSAITSEAAQAILARVKKWITPSSAGIGFRPFLANFLAQGDERCVAMICNFNLVVESDPVEGIKQYLRATLPESAVLDFAAAAIGIAKELADREIRNGNDAIVDAARFRTRFRAFVRKHNLAGLLNPTTGEPDAADIEKTIGSAPTYVRQLNAINLTAELIVGAVSACLRTTADKVNWAADGLIVENSLDEFDSSLESRFALVRDEIEDLHASSPEELRGRLVYRRCAAIELPLEGRSLPQHFVQGAFNILADRVRVGWHPSYATLFEKE